MIVKDDEPALALRYAGDKKYRWYIVGTRSREPFKNEASYENTSEGEAKAKTRHATLHLQWEGRRRAKAKSQ